MHTQPLSLSASSFSSFSSSSSGEHQKRVFGPLPKETRTHAHTTHQNTTALKEERERERERERVGKRSNARRAFSLFFFSCNDDDDDDDDDAKDITTSFFITHAMMMRCNATFCVKVAKVFGTRRARCCFCLRRLYYAPMMRSSSFTS